MMHMTSGGGLALGWTGHLGADITPLKLKYALAQNDGGVWGEDPDGDDDTVVLRSTDQSACGEWRLSDPARRKLTQAERRPALLREGDLVVTKSSGSAQHIGKTSLVTAEIAEMGACYGNFMQRIRARKEFDPKYLWYLLNHDIVRTQFDLLSNSTTGLANLNGSIIGSVVVPQRSPTAQRVVVSFLDLETAQIDGLIGKQERLIELLAERRSAMIAHAVTRGLDPGAPLRDSGVEWLGDMPASWRIKPLWTMFGREKSTGFPDEEMLSVYRDHGVIRKSSRSDNINKTAENRDIYQIVDAGWLVANRMKAWQGSVGISLQRGIVSGHYIVFRPKHVESNAFLNFLFRSRPYTHAYGLLSRGVRIGQAEIDNDHYRALPVLLPPIEVQGAIVDRLERDTAKIDALIAKAKAMNVVLRERRSALISAAVMGKIDVTKRIEGAA